MAIATASGGPRRGVRGDSPGQDVEGHEGSALLPVCLIQIEVTEVAGEREGVLALMLQAARLEALGVVQDGVVGVAAAELAEPQPGGVRAYLRQAELGAERAGKGRAV
jgi:hypothetical protein